MRTASFLCVMLCIVQLDAQQPSPAPLPPSQEYKAAMAPFETARSQADDLTNADQLALSVGMARAAKDCVAEQTALTQQSPAQELLAQAQLCLFGQMYEPARAAVVQYLATPNPPEREAALIFLSQAFLGLHDSVNAAYQVLSLERDYPYDARIHAAGVQVILAGALSGEEANSNVLQLCQQQFAHTLPQLESGKGMSGTNGSIAPQVLTTDAVRCFDIERDLSDLSAAPTLQHLRQIVRMPVWQNTAELAPMQDAVARATLAGTITPEPMLKGSLVRAVGPMVLRSVLLSHGAVLVIPFALWSPSTLNMAQDFPKTLPTQRIYFVTSWAANTGSTDVATPEILASMRAFARLLPKQGTLLVIPDAQLQSFHASAFPGVLVVHDGVVGLDAPLVGEAGKRLAIFALKSGATHSR